MDYPNTPPGKLCQASEISGVGSALDSLSFTTTCLEDLTTMLYNSFDVALRPDAPSTACVDHAKSVSGSKLQDVINLINSRLSTVNAALTALKDRCDL